MVLKQGVIVLILQKAVLNGERMEVERLGSNLSVRDILPYIKSEFLWLLLKSLILIYLLNHRLSTESMSGVALTPIPII